MSCARAFATTSPERAVDLIGSAPEGATLLLDFDWTLLLANSSECYLSGVPDFLRAPVGFIARLLTRSLEPRSRRARTRIRDWSEIVVASLLCPWLMLGWKKRARELANQKTNRAITGVLRRRPDIIVIVISIGFEELIGPILKHMPCGHRGLVACRLREGPFQRRRGKLDLIRRRLGKRVLADAILLTDSNDDRTLLAVAGVPIRSLWDAQEEPGENGS